MDKYGIAATAATIGFGAAEVLAPDTVLKMFGVRPDDLNGVARTTVRSFGGRNLTLGSMLLTASGRRAVRSGLPVLVLAEAAAVGLALTQDEVKPMLPALGGAATLAIAALVWKAR